jgi:peptidoglycan/LPS O-acetylase OafA/YrhL
MQTKNLTYMPRMDVLRFIAAAAVILYHTYTWGPKWEGKYVPELGNLIFLRGSVGVSLFMVMSGYLMAQIFMKYPHATFGEFIHNRFVRIAPLCMLLVVGGIASHDSSTQVFHQVLNILTLQFNVDRANLIAPLWTIATEFQFYLIMPILAAVIAKSGLSSFVKLVAFIGIFRMMIMTSVVQWAEAPYNTVYYSIIGRFDQFAVGIVLAHMPEDWKRYFRNPLHLIVGIGIFAGLFFVASSNPWWDRTPMQVLFQSYHLTAEAIVCGYFMISFMNASIRIPFERQLAGLGAASYSMYLLHEMVARQYLALFPQQILGLRLDAVLIVLPTVCGLSLLSYHFFEKPFLSFRKAYSTAAR